MGALGSCSLENLVFCLCGGGFFVCLFRVFFLLGCRAGFERQFLLCRVWLKTLTYSAVLWIVQVGRSREGQARGRSCRLGATLNGLVVLQLSGPN